MKKLLFILAAVVAVSAQAAYVDWEYAVQEQKSGGTDWTASGYTAYLLTATAWDGIKDNVTASALSGAATDSSSFYLAAEAKKTYTYATGAGSAGARQAVGDSGNYYVILATPDGYNVALNNVSITAYNDQSSGGTGLTPGLVVDEGSPTTGSSISFTPMSSGGSSGGVPEPTSGLLLALGGAMLALRRRR